MGKVASRFRPTWRLLLRVTNPPHLRRMAIGERHHEIGPLDLRVETDPRFRRRRHGRYRLLLQAWRS